MRIKLGRWEITLICGLGLIRPLFKLYLFHPRPVKHATHFQLPIIAAMNLVEAIRQRCNGSVKRFRYILTHSDGKLELVGLLEGSPMQLVARWHQVRRGLDKSGLMLFGVDEDTVWLGD